MGEKEPNASRRLIRASAPRARAEHGQILIEYALVLMLVVVVSVALVGTVGEDVSAMLSRVAGGF